MKKRTALTMAMLAALALANPVQSQDEATRVDSVLSIEGLPFELRNYVLHASFDGPEMIASEFTGVTARDFVQLKIFNEGPARARDVQVEIAVPGSRSATLVHHYILRGQARVGSCDEPVNTNHHSTMLCTIKGIGPGKTRTIGINLAAEFSLYEEGDPAPIIEVEARVTPAGSLVMLNGQLTETARGHWPLATTGGKSSADIKQGRLVDEPPF